MPSSPSWRVFVRRAVTTENPNMPTTVPPKDLDPDLIEQRRIIPLSEVARLTSLSVDSLKRNHSDKIRQLGPRRIGMSLADALNIGLTSLKP
jgi:hypothetical protein